MPQKRTTCSPLQVQKVLDQASSRECIYIEYTSKLSPNSARRILLLLGLCILVAEVSLRLHPVHYARTAISSLKGVAALCLESTKDKGPKVLAVGDSMLLGGGISEDEYTVMGRYKQRLPKGVRVYNLAVPSGDASTSALILRWLERNGVNNVRLVIIQTSPLKLMSQGNDSGPMHPALPAVAELAALLPGLEPDNLPPKASSPDYQEHFERWLGWKLAQVSELYASRDWFRIQHSGDYPAFWLAELTVPRSIIAKLAPQKSDGLNRLGANLEDFPYSALSTPKTSPELFNFAPDEQMGHLEECISAASRLGSPALLLSMPVHIQAYARQGAQEASLRDVINKAETAVSALGARHDCPTIICRSTDFTNPELWTRTPAHFNRKGAELIWLRSKELWPIPRP